MDIAAVVDLGHQALWMVVLISAPLLGVSLAVCCRMARIHMFASAVHAGGLWRQFASTSAAKQSEIRGQCVLVSRCSSSKY